MSRHTPGPWSMAPWSKNSAALIDRSGGLVATITPQSASSRHDWDSNAALIAAAPEMLEALRGLLAECGVSTKVPGSLSTNNTPGTRAAWAAICKAEGRT